MDRRLFLGALALSTVAAVTGGALIGDDFYLPKPPEPMDPRGEGVPRRFPRPMPTAVQLPPHFVPPNLTPIPLPGGTIFDLPGDGNLLALTVDDGASTEVVNLYAQFASLSGLRLTFFLNGSRPAWTDNAAVLRPLVESGQIQLGNHTWSHADLTSLSNSEIEDELMDNDDFIRTTYGVEARPYFRPPFGYHDERVDDVARGLGYSTPVMWYGSLSDSSNLTDQQLLGFAQQWLLPQHIVIGHANFPTVTRLFDQIAGIIRDRGLQPITLDDLFLRP